MANTIEVADSIWNWVGNALDLDGDSRIAMELWRSGKKKPTFRQLEAFSKRTHVPLGYFFLSTPPAEDLGILAFRSVEGPGLHRPSRNLVDIARQMEDIQEWMREHVVALRGEKVPFAASLDACSDVLALAESVRKTLDITANWQEKSRSVNASFKFLREAIGNAGVMAMVGGIVGSNTRRTLDAGEFRAFALADEFVPLIFVNSSDSLGGMLFSLIHAFIHVGIGSSCLYNARLGDTGFVNPHETACNAVTVEILVPTVAFGGAWSAAEGRASGKIACLADRFRCSQAVIVQKAFDMQFISGDQYGLLMSKARESEKGKLYGTRANGMDRRFLLALNGSVHEGTTLHTEAYRLTRSNGSGFEGMVKKAEGESNCKARGKGASR